MTRRNRFDGLGIPGMFLFLLALCVVRAMSGSRLSNVDDANYFVADAFSSLVDGHLSGLREKYADADQLDIAEWIDPWCTPFRPTRMRQGNLVNIEVRSTGPDRTFSTADDITKSAPTAAGGDAAD